jgi:hypothetical protein
MKKIITSSILLCVLFLTGCIKNELTLLSDSVVEFDATTWNANSAGVTFPYLTKVPVPGIVTPSTQPTLSRTTGTVSLRVNLVGAQKTTDTNFDFIVSSETNAVAGTHYTAITGKGTIPANSSFGTVTITILDPGATTGTKDLVLQLVDNSSIKASVNYAKVGLRISQL